MGKIYRPPADPRIGQLFFDHPTGTMRRWDGKHWAEQPKPGARKELPTNQKGKNDE